jgi:Kef-type K+ transport system membrane component KefB
MIPRGEVGMIVAQIGLASGSIEQHVYGVVVAMAVLTTVIAPPLLKIAYRGCPARAPNEDFSLA